jgi:hypothetical protein
MLKAIFANLTQTNAAPAAPAIRVLSAGEVAAVAGGPELGHDVKPNALIVSVPAV